LLNLQKNCEDLVPAKGALALTMSFLPLVQCHLTVLGFDYFCCLIYICWILLKVSSSILTEFITFFLLLPGIYIYLSSTCPLNTSFDTKKEIKRVLRGYHLPDNHPSKPRSSGVGNFIEEWTTRITASVTTELSTAISGYSIDMIPLGWGMATYTTVDIPSPLSLHCEWIGIHNKWYHIRTYSTATTTPTTT